ncbi:hypothetical protein [Azomonas macrocytogenes]|uniref:VWFA domain-containing protein n=1 Tax=Azomonas macrocytogenes TaxID=69962 RepID=A0A839T0C6_AZOMA|nr:hypothetical protein [Azomonas macrocytogenes]MBB3103017.1 hypothetical protein [Azomonas macrocytogenes]
MKRISRLSGETRNAEEVLNGHAELIQILKRHLPPSTTALFAKPRQAEGDVVEWYSDLGGQPVPFSELSEKEAAQVRHLLDERLTSIEQLATRLEEQGEEGKRQAGLLRQATAYPDTATLYSLNGQPVVTFWGGGEPPPPPAPPPLPAGEPPLPGAIPAAMLAIEPRKRRWWPWLLLLLLLLALLAALWWWFYGRQPEQPPAPPVEPPATQEEKPQPPKEEPPAPKPEEPKEEPKPEPPVPEVEPEKEPVPEPEPKPEVKPEPPKPEPKPVPKPEPKPEPKPIPKPEPKPEPKPDPTEQVKKRIAAAGNNCTTLQQIQTQEPLLKQHPELKEQVEQKLKQNCRQQQIANAKNLCPNERPKELAPELAIVFDASGSMDISLLATEAEIKQASMVQGVTDIAAQILLGGNPGINTMGRIFREPKRITAAREATTQVVQRLPSDVNAGLVLIEDCPRARNAGFYSPAERGSLLSRIRGISPVQGTPLADGIAKGGQMLDGVNRESVMLVVSDGGESCGQDPCAVAQALARSKPHLKINVIDILGTGAGNCLARATGGQVFTVRNAGDLNMMTRQAAQDVLPPAHCRP